MLELLKEMPRTSKYVFESRRNKGHAIVGFAKMLDKLRSLTWPKDWQLHDLRRSFATGAARIGILPHIISGMLNHSSGRSVTEVHYNHFRYEDEKREALQRWQLHLEKVVEEHKNFVPHNELNDVVI